VKSDLFRRQQPIPANTAHGLQGADRIADVLQHAAAEDDIEFPDFCTIESVDAHRDPLHLGPARPSHDPEAGTVHRTPVFVKPLIVSAGGSVVEGPVNEKVVLNIYCYDFRCATPLHLEGEEAVGRADIEAAPSLKIGPGKKPDGSTKIVQPRSNNTGENLNSMVPVGVILDLRHDLFSFRGPR